jgi:hypothetical protein
MNKKQIYFLVFIILIVVIFLALLLNGISKSKVSSNELVNLSENQIECYENLLYHLEVDQNITRDHLNVQHVNCMSAFTDKNYLQSELTGTYFEDENHESPPELFYFYELGGGMAASGADTYYEVCLIIGDETIRSEILTGRNLNFVGKSTCSWKTKLP